MKLSYLNQSFNLFPNQCNTGAAMASKRREHVSFTWLSWLPAMTTMAAMEAMAAIIKLRIFGMKKTKRNDNELFKGWIKSVSS